MAKIHTWPRINRCVDVQRIVRMGVLDECLRFDICRYIHDKRRIQRLAEYIVQQLGIVSLPHGPTKEPCAEVVSNRPVSCVRVDDNDSRGVEINMSEDKWQGGPS